MGFVIFYKNDDSNNEILKKHVTFLSKILSKDGLYVNNCIEKVVEKYCQSFDKIHFWCDAGGHFRNKEFLIKF